MKQFLVIGNPIKHSRSPQLHHAFACELNIPITYTRHLSTTETFLADLKAAQQQGICGANITAPFKELAYGLMDTLTEAAQEARAVNTIRFEPDGTMTGHNTDGLGLVTDLIQRRHIDLTGRRVLVIGAGGAASGIMGPLLALPIANLCIANRTIAHAEDLCARFQNHQHKLSITPLPGGLNPPADLVINTTPLADLALFRPYVSEAAVFYNLNYDEHANRVGMWCQQFAPLRYYDGLGMLIEQGALAFEFWHQVRPNTEKFPRYALD